MIYTFLIKDNDMAKDIILVNYDKCDEDLYYKVFQVRKYNLTVVNDYSTFMRIYKKKKYDLALVNIEDKLEHDLVIYYMCQQDTHQKVLTCSKLSSDCFFKQDCTLCHKYNIKPFLSLSNTLNIQYYIDNFDLYKCKFH